MADDDAIPLRQPKPCPICGKPSQTAFHPFCSARCADVDLNRWLSNAYVIPGGDNVDAEEPDGVPTLPTADDDA